MVVFSGCSGGLYLKSKMQISEYRSCLFYLKSEDFVAAFTSGKREKDFFYDGKKTRLIPFGVIAVKYLSDVDINSEYEFMLLIDSRQYIGKLEYNPVDSTFVADIGKEITEDSDIYLRLWGGGISDQAHMECLSKNWVSYKNAFKEAIKSNQESIKKHIKGNRIRGEFFIKIVGETSLQHLAYYVQFIGAGKKGFVSLVDVYSGNITYTKDL